MLKILLIVLALAAYGASSIFDKFSSPDAAAEAEATESSAPAAPSLLSSVTSMAVSAVSSASGVNIAAMPEEGCAAGALSEDKLAELFNSLPESQAELLRQLVDNSGASNLTVEWYSGELGTGVCVPAKQLVFLIPPTLTETLSSLSSSVSLE